MNFLKLNILNQKTALQLSQKVGNLKTIWIYIGNINTNHRFYMDDLKLFAKDDHNLEGQLQTKTNFSDDIGMEFGLIKCAKATYEKRILIKSKSIKSENDKTKKELQQEVYRYLGVIESNEIQHGTMREKIRNECY